MEINRKKIILVEDDKSLGYLLSEYLSMNNFLVDWVKDGESCIDKIQSTSYDLGILDVKLPDMNGFELAERIKQISPSFPFVFLTSRSLKIDVLKGFSLGAVDYLKKPIDEEILVVRINNLLNRMAGQSVEKRESGKQSLGTYIFNPDNQELIFENESIALTTKENELLSFLYENRNSLCSHREILLKIWGKNDYFSKKSLNVFITHLRKYLSRDNTIRIDNIHNKGFILRLKD